MDGHGDKFDGFYKQRLLLAVDADHKDGNGGKRGALYVGDHGCGGGSDV